MLMLGAPRLRLADARAMPARRLQVAPGKVTTKWPGKDCAVGRSYADVAMGTRASRC